MIEKRMVQSQIDEQTQKYMERTITLNPFLMQELGIIRNKCMIQTDDYKLSCVPYILSLRNCKVLLILSPREQTIITGGVSNLMLHLEFQLPDYKNAVPMFIRIQLRDFKQLNTNSNQCLLTADFLNIPVEYKGILVRHFRSYELLEKMYNSAVDNAKTFNHKDITRINLKKHISLRMDKGEKITARIIDTSLIRMTVFVDVEEEALKNLPESFLVEVKQSEIPFFLNASLGDYTPSTEVEGYYIVRLNLSFSSALATCLYPLYPKTENPDSTL
ncbi:MAG: hypothetical protein B6241_13075 [Spirochaetaceae bacterium 4572_59]|nr:MAG: hypothetical protein B6241_13075 [Spirochaetaceae bacterium 4572_59]